ncbi:hypothetical protein [Streptomyces sp. NPDC000878]
MHTAAPWEACSSSGTSPVRTATPAPGGPPKTSRRGHVIDPVRGTTVDLAATGLTPEYDGILHGLCVGRCRRVFADEHGVPLTA